jgi:GNAT superfamily N-acetyltransferase
MTTPVKDLSNKTLKLLNMTKLSSLVLLCILGIIVIVVIIITRKKRKKRIKVDASYDLIHRDSSFDNRCFMSEYLKSQHEMFMFMFESDEGEKKLYGICTYTRERDHIFVHWVCLEEEHRGKGHGTIFITKMIEHFRNLDSNLKYIELVSERDRRAYYERIGFKKTGERGLYRYYLHT